MTDVLLFGAIVAVVVVAGIVVGIIVAGRIDRLMTPRPVATPDPGQPEEEQP